jgi:drug/metabolite transporter (DMT)-like permease
VSLLQAGGILISLVGVLAIISKGALEALTSLTFNRGDLVILLNQGFWALYSAALRKRGVMHWLSSTFLLATISSLAMLPLWFYEHASGETFALTPFTLGALAFVGLFPSLLAYAAWSRGVELIGSGRAGVFLHLIPLYSALAAGAALGERIEGYHIVGFALILAGVVLASRKA